MTLIEKLESATGPDRELDCRAHCAKVGDDFDLMRRVVPDFNQWACPYYTGSIDAAMTLVPEDTESLPWNVTTASHYGSASVIPVDGKSTGVCDERTGHGRAATLPLAICIAAIKARVI